MRCWYGLRGLPCPNGCPTSTTTTVDPILEKQHRGDHPEAYKRELPPEWVSPGPSPPRLVYEVTRSAVGNCLNIEMAYCGFARGFSVSNDQLHTERDAFVLARFVLSELDALMVPADERSAAAAAIIEAVGREAAGPAGRTVSQARNGPLPTRRGSRRLLLF